MPEGGRKESKWPFDSSLVPKPKNNTGNFRRGQAAGGLLRVPGDAHGSLAANLCSFGLLRVPEKFGPSGGLLRGSRDEATNVDELRHVLGSRVLLQ